MSLPFHNSVFFFSVAIVIVVRSSHICFSVIPFGDSHWINSFIICLCTKIKMCIILILWLWRLSWYYMSRKQKWNPNKHRMGKKTFWLCWKRNVEQFSGNKMWNRQAKQKFQLTQTFFKTNIIFKKIFWRLFSVFTHSFFLSSFFTLFLSSFFLFFFPYLFQFLQKLWDVIFKLHWVWCVFFSFFHSSYVCSLDAIFPQDALSKCMACHVMASSS